MLTAKQSCGCGQVCELCTHTAQGQGLNPDHRQAKQVSATAPYPSPLLLSCRKRTLLLYKVVVFIMYYTDLLLCGNLTTNIPPENWCTYKKQQAKHLHQNRL